MKRRMDPDRRLQKAWGAMLLGCLAGVAMAADPAATYVGSAKVPETHLDRCMAVDWKARGITPAPTCSDAVFMRRVYLDLCGTLPEPWDVGPFLQDKDPKKRAKLVNKLLEREEYAYYRALRWCDVLRVKSEFPINLWPNAVQAYHRWVLESMRDNKPYDQFARELLTSSGSNFRVPPVNFYRAVQGKEPEALARAVALTFLGSRLDTWPEDRKTGLTNMFSRVGFKGTAEWKEEIVMFDPNVTEGMRGMLPDGTMKEIAWDEDPRQVFAEWLLQGSGQEWFARAMVNRTWAWCFGTGFVDEADDIRPENPPVHPAAYQHLAEAFAESGYDTKELFRLIMNSRTYQQSCVPRNPDEISMRMFACYPVRRLDAEVLIDALCQLTGTRERYMSPIPEPFTFIPESQRTIELADGSITSAFLEMFGRPPRDTGRVAERNSKPSDAQSLHLLNSTHIQRKIERSSKLRNFVAKSRNQKGGAIRAIYFAVLTRPPTPEEAKVVGAYFKTPGINAKQAADDITWALINSKEFQHHH